MGINEQIKKEVDTLFERIVNIRHDIHQNPELSGKEKETNLLLRSILEAEGISFKRFENHYGLVADIVKDPALPTVAIRGDMDALPMPENSDKPYASKKEGIMHACGHDAHTATALGCALVLNRIKEKLPGNVRIIFQPAEEILEGGSNQMIEDGALEGVSAIFGLHVYPYLRTGQIGYKYGVMMASADTFSFDIYGKTAHGARPHEGIDAVLVAAMVINSLNHIVSRRIDPLHPAVISMGKIEGGNAPNIICDFVTVAGTVRTVNESVRRKIPEMMETTIKGICTAMDAKYHFNYQFGPPELTNNDHMVDIVKAAAEEVVGKEGLVDLVDPVMGGEDFSRYLQIVPGAFFRLGVCNEEKGTCVPQHNTRFDVDDDALTIGMKILCLSAVKALREAKG
ncbi:amidohydrolase [Hydrogenimonas urashimensis]|uniref:amidohydrolase n=1 Tax=Hydrogenimonas urashimensis TaxID=2740515 RepID=UPI00191602AE|nr:amidohydrolase [Hydrogenimonas urashimensis]